MGSRRIVRIVAFLSLAISNVTYYSNVQAQSFAGYDFPDCTWYAATRRPDLTVFHANAKEWDDQARLYGFPAVTTPVVGAIVVFEPRVQGADSTYGHVAYVERIVSQTTYEVSEYNWGSTLIERSSLHVRTASTGSGVSFILHKGELPPTPPATLPPNGHWSGTLTQYNPDLSYPMTLVLKDCAIGKECGSTFYDIKARGGTCGGALTLNAVSGSVYIFHERVVFSNLARSRCADANLHFQRSWGYYWALTVEAAGEGNFSGYATLEMTH